MTGQERMDQDDQSSQTEGRERSDSLGPLPLLTPDMTDAERNVIAPPAPLYKIVLTGGPCGGKTTALARLSSYLRERGFEVITCPEAFSILISNGMAFEYLWSVDGMGPVVQNTVMDMQMSLEDGFERVLRARGRPAVLLCDRGLMDGSAYMSSDEWDRFLKKRGVESVCDLREGRYNAVFHLVTAAEGAEKYYTLENNEVRTETPEQARELDGLTRSAWVGHPKLFVFDNSTDFEGKLQRLVETTANLVGLPTSLSRKETKFLLRTRPLLENFPDDIKYHIFDVEKVYLYDDIASENGSTQRLASSQRLAASEYIEEYSFVRKRTHVLRDGSEGGSVYGQTTVKRAHDGQKIEVKRIITKREYRSALKTRDPNRHIVRQKRISFLWKMQSFNVHVYSEPVSDVCILHAQVESKLGDDEEANGTDVDLPPFLDVDRPLRNKEDTEKFGAFNISLIERTV